MAAALRLFLRIAMGVGVVAAVIWLLLRGDRDVQPPAPPPAPKTYPRDHFLRDIDFDRGQINLVLDRGVFADGPVIQRDQALLRDLADSVSIPVTNADRRRTIIDALFGGPEAFDRRPAILIYRGTYLIGDLGCMGTICLDDAETQAALRPLIDTADILQRHKVSFTDHGEYLAQYARVRQMPDLLTFAPRAPERVDDAPISFTINLPASLHEIPRDGASSSIDYELALEAAAEQTFGDQPGDATWIYARNNLRDDPVLIDTCNNGALIGELTGWSLWRPQLSVRSDEAFYDLVTARKDWSFLPDPGGRAPGPVIASAFPRIDPDCAGFPGRSAHAIHGIAARTEGICSDLGRNPARECR